MVVASNGSGSLRLGAGGSEKVRITSAGSVGIGTNAPQAPLHIFGSSDILFEIESTDRYSHIDLTDTSSTARITNDGGTGTLRLRADKDNAVNNSNIQFEIDGSEKVRITSAGFVGISNISPELQSSAARNLVIGTPGSGGQNGLTICSNTSGTNNIYFGDASSGGESMGRIVYSHADDSLRLHTVVEERLRITSTGNIGIGTNNPEEELSIQLDSSSDGPTLRLRNANGGDGTFTGRISTRCSWNIFCWH